MATAARRSSPICLSCQTRLSLISFRNLSTSRHRSQTASAAANNPSDADKFILPPPKQDLSFSALSRNRDIRLAVLRSLRNPCPPRPTGRQIKAPRLPPPTSTTIPHNVFRQNLRSAIGTKAIRAVLRLQLLQSSTPRAILQVVAAAFTTSTYTANALAALEEPIIRALFRCRDTASDPEILRTLNAILWRFEQSHCVVVDPQLRYMALKFAARARCLKSMKHHLRALRREGIGMTSTFFRAVIAKTSIGHRGLGEIRNGRWKRGELVQVLMGFEGDDELPACHLGSFMERDDWQFLHGWVAVLARCKEREEVWKEWELWKVSPRRLRARALVRPSDSEVKLLTSRSRGDHWFLEQVAMSGNLEGAWKVLYETDIVFSSIKMRVRDKMLETPEFVTVWDEGVRAAMVQKWDRDLGAIEKALGVKWVGKNQDVERAVDGIVGTDSDAEGHHELFMDQEEALDKLGEEGWKLAEEYGFPYEEDDVIVPHRERELHEAVELVP